MARGGFGVRTHGLVVVVARVGRRALRRPTHQAATRAGGAGLTLDQKEARDSSRSTKDQRGPGPAGVTWHVPCGGGDDTHVAGHATRHVAAWHGACRDDELGAEELRRVGDGLVVDDARLLPRPQARRHAAINVAPGRVARQAKPRHGHGHGHGEKAARRRRAGGEQQRAAGRRAPGRGAGGAALAPRGPVRAKRRRRRGLLCADRATCRALSSRTSLRR